ncbi:MAG: nucleoside hydrolase [Planctomycetia bacterium]|nr:nucleoside hydrolase [Planctomycetia bacterium]
MVQKLILDIDPGMQDALVLSLALFEPEVEIVALTSVGGRVSPQQSARNIRGIVELLDPPKLPRMGMGEDADEGFNFETNSFGGTDGLGGFQLPVAERRTPIAAEKVICDTVRNHPGEVSILSLGPLTNVARAFRRDPEIPRLMKRLYIGGGTYNCPGDITPSAEFNIYSDPKAAQFVFRSPGTKTLIPLDLADQLRFSVEILKELPSSEQPFGAFVQHIFVSLFRSFRQYYGMESVCLHELAAFYAVFMPSLFETKYAACEVEILGVLTEGEIVYDRRHRTNWRHNIEVFHAINDPALLREKMIRDLNRIDKRIRDR